MTGLKIGGVPEHFNLPWRLAIEEGKFREIGMDLHWADMGGGTGQMIRGLETGSIDIAVLLTEGITKAILEGLPAKIIQVYVVSPLHWGIHVPTNSTFKTVHDLKNQTFAVTCLVIIVNLILIELTQIIIISRKKLYQFQCSRK